MTFPPRTQQGWDEWWEGFKRRHPEAFPVPPPDAKTPPKPHSDTDRDEETRP